MPRKPEFSIISPGWNCEKYVGPWYRSIIKQAGDYKWQAYVMDDCSDDDTVSAIKKLNDSRIRVIRNSAHRGAAYSRLRLIRMCEPDSVMVMLDLDDWLIQDAFKSLAKAYNTPTVKATFGRYATNKGGGIDNNFYTKAEINNNTFINCKQFKAPPLRTFHASLVDCIEDKDMKDSSGKWYITATDVALSWRFLWELTYDQIRLLPNVVYVYRQRGSASAKRFDKSSVMVDLRRKYASMPFPESKNAKKT